MICDERQFEETELTKMIVKALWLLSTDMNSLDKETNLAQILAERIKKEKLDVVLVPRDY